MAVSSGAWWFNGCQRMNAAVFSALTCALRAGLHVRGGVDMPGGLRVSAGVVRDGNCPCAAAR
jgi:hypothetical protein